MTKSLSDKLKKLPKNRRATIQKRADQLIGEEMSLRSLRQALSKTQKDLALKLHMSQDSISRLEKRSDILLSTLGKYISALGGTLKMTAEFPHKPPVTIHGISDFAN